MADFVQAVPPMKLTAAIATLVVAASPALAQTPSFTLINPAPGYTETRGAGVSADGTTVAGYSGTTTVDSSFIWSAGSGRIDFGLSGPGGNLAVGISGNGQYIFGGGLIGTDQSTRHTYRWSAAGGYENLGRISGWDSTISTGINGDGSVIVGYTQTISGAAELSSGYRWTAASGYQMLPQLRPTSQIMHVQGVSRDGSVTVGVSQPSSFGGPGEAFRWTPQGGTQELISTVNPLFSDTNASAVSGNGQVIVGSGLVAATNREHPFRWTAQGGMVDLGLPSGAIDADALLTNLDGSVVLGSMEVGVGTRSFIWRDGVGFSNFSDYLTANGVSIPTGFTSFSVAGVSDDGLTFVGWCGNDQDTIARRAFVATVPSPGTLGVLLACLGLRRRR